MGRMKFNGRKTIRQQNGYIDATMQQTNKNYRLEEANKWSGSRETDSKQKNRTLRVIRKN